ncbi:MAG: glycoside hydrolase family 36 N-terminal domain-containing protein [Microthrixaceae bacterium]
MIHIDAGGWGLTWGADDRRRLRQVGLGPSGHEAQATTELVWYPDAHPAWGDSDPFRPAALRVTHHDGTLTTRPVFLGCDRGPRPDGQPGEHVVVTTRDELFEVFVRHHFLTHPDSGVLEQWVEVENGEPAAVRLHDYDSMAPFLLVGNGTTITQFGGSGWADEWRWTTQHLHPGLTNLSSLRGIQPHLQRPDAAGRQRGLELHRGFHPVGRQLRDSSSTCARARIRRHRGRCDCGQAPAPTGPSTPSSRVVPSARRRWRGPGPPAEAAGDSTAPPVDPLGGDARPRPHPSGRGQQLGGHGDGLRRAASGRG